MLLTRLYLRNFRVYEDELDLELPPGLVGIYGPNGSGKSTLLEAVVWTLWGKARTTKEHVRSAGVGGDCVTEVEFEHEGHLYLMRRTLSGINASPRLEARCDGLMMSEGVRDASRYIESVLGLDDSAFRASVFAEQKQLAAFSDRRSEDRRRLVLRLLGITPLDAARDAARRDARRTTSDHERLRGLLADLDNLREEAEDAKARAAAASVTAQTAQSVAATTARRAEAAAAAMTAHEQRRQEHEALVREGRSARNGLDSLDEAVQDQQADLDALLAEAGALPQLQATVAGAERAEAELAALSTAAAAVVAVQRIVVPPEPAPGDRGAVEAAESDAADAERRVAELEGFLQAAREDAQRAHQAARRSATLSGEADCPVCGQALGDAFEQVQAHRAEEVAAAEARLTDLSARAGPMRGAADEAKARRARAVAAAEMARTARQEWELAYRRHQEATVELSEAWSSVLAVAPERTGPGSDPPSVAQLVRDTDEARARVQLQRAAAAELERLRARLERRSTIEASLTANRERVAVARGRLQALREKLHALGFDPQALEHAAAAHREALEAARTSTERAQQAAIEAAREQVTSEAAEARLVDAEAQHAKLSELAGEARHLARVADLLSEFRNTVVACVGPRLAVQAAELFGELTDHEYDELLVDPETYELQISDGGRVFGLDRFSGSEIDLANLALRVAISEHIHFQSGGSIGLLVLDEVFGPLDEDRKARMLLALERLRGRFRQVLVVTHDPAIKEQLPNAIEVVKRPGRRATARVVTP
jgi:exonuclease SbcC